MRGWHGVSNHRQVDCLFTRLRTQKTSMLRIIGRFVIGNHKCSVDSPLKGPVTQKLFSWHDAIKARLQFISFFFIYGQITWLLLKVEKHGCHTATGCSFCSFSPRRYTKLPGQISTWLSLSWWNRRHLYTSPTAATLTNVPVQGTSVTRIRYVLITTVK